MSVLPEWPGADGGSGCINEDCDATGRWVTIASRREVQLLFPRKDRLHFWPLPDQATHVCTSCGYVYDGVSSEVEFDRVEHGQVDVDVADWEWNRDIAYDETIREATRQLISGAPDGVRVSELADAIVTEIPGVGRSFLHEVLTEVDGEFAHVSGGE